eukprot:363104-Chlamydomonas_euryale.AAC.5
MCNPSRPERDAGYGRPGERGATLVTDAQAHVHPGRHRLWAAGSALRTAESRRRRRHRRGRPCRRVLMRRLQLKLLVVEGAQMQVVRGKNLQMGQGGRSSWVARS